MNGLLEPKHVTINNREFIISKFTPRIGRKIITQYLATGLPKIGNYADNEVLMDKLLSFVAVQKGDVIIRLSTPDLIDNHTGDWETLVSVEKAMMEYNCSFFQDGRIWTFFENAAQHIHTWTSKISTVSSVLSSPTAKPPSTS